MPDEPLILVLPARPDPERESVAQAWTACGGTVQFLERFWEPPPMSVERVRLYGDQVFCLVVAEKLGLELISPPDDLLSRVHHRWLSRALSVTRLRDALSEPFPSFIKPLLPKLFPASVYQDEPSLTIAADGVPPESLVFVAEPVPFLCEARCLVKEGRVTDVSIYEGAGEIASARAFAQAFVHENPLPITLGPDIGWIDGRGWALIEANPVWGMGLNGCDSARMTDCLRLAARPR